MYYRRRKKLVAVFLVSTMVEGVGISYYDATNGDPKYASKEDGDSWNNATIISINQNNTKDI